MTRSSRRPFRPLRATITTAAVVAIAAAGVGAGPVAADPEWANLNDSFVQRDSSRLTLDGQTFRASGTNIYWLGLDENVGGVDYPTYFRIKDALDTASHLGINVVRSHMMTSTAQSDQNSLAIMPSLGNYNEEAFATIDFAIAYAGSLGIRLVLPLTDEWSYYHGGHRDFTTPLGLSSADFYSDPDAIAAYQDYVDHILARTNSLTGVKYVDDPTILAWELGNELEGMTLPWINEQVEHIKSQAPNQLVAAGRRFDIDPDTLAATDLDIVDVHYYPPTAQRVSADAATVANAGKVYIAGEYASTAATTELLSAAAADPQVSGMFFWSLFGNNDRGGFVPHDDGFTLHYPGGSEREADSVAAIQAYGEAVGAPSRTAIADAALITAIDKNYGINVVSWRGTAGAVSYIVERSVNGADWVSLTESAVQASASPVTDFESPANAQYRIVPIDAAGTRGPVSDVVEAPADGATFVDPLQDWRLTSSRSNVQIVPTENGGVVSRVSDGEASEIVWQRTGLQKAEFIVSNSSGVSVEVSSNGTDWSTAATTISSRGELSLVSAASLSGNFVRLSWMGQLVAHRATITSVPERVALFDPLDDFSKTVDHAGSLSFDPGNASSFGGDASRVKRDSADPSSLTWTYDNISGIDVDAWYWPDQTVVPLTLEISADGTSWTSADATVTGGTGNWKKYVYSLRGLTGVNFVRVSWPVGGGEVWTPQIGAASIYSPNAVPLGAPGVVQLEAPSAEAASIKSTPTFAWQPAKDAAYYTFTLSESKNLKKPIATATGITATQLRPDVDLKPDTKYYWRVTAVNGEGATESERRSFVTAALPTERVIIEDFEAYADSASLKSAYVRNSGGGAISPELVSTSSGQSGRFDYDLGTAGYAGVVRTLASAQSWWGYRGIELTVDSSASNDLALQFVANGAYWEAQVALKPGAQTVTVPFSDFAPPAWAPAANLDLTSVSQYAFYLSGNTAVGSITVDNVRTVLETGVTAPADAKFNVIAPDGFVVAGSKIEVTASGLEPGESFVVSVAGVEEGSGKADKRGQIDKLVRVPADLAAGEAQVTVTGAATNRVGSDSITVIEPAKKLGLRLTSTGEIRANKQITIVATGLEPGEQVKVSLAGRQVSAMSARADGSGSYELTFSAGKSTGKHTIKVTGATNQRFASLKITVLSSK